MGKDGFHAAVATAFEDVGAIDRRSAAVFGAEEMKGQIVVFNGRVHQNIARGVVDKGEVRFGDIDGGVHAIGGIVAYGVGVVATIDYLHTTINGGAENSGRDLADATTKLRLGLVVLDDQFWQIPVLAVDISQVSDKGKLLVGGDQDVLELLEGAGDIEDAVFWGALKISVSLTNQFLES